MLFQQKEALFNIIICLTIAILYGIFKSYFGIYKVPITLAILPLIVILSLAFRTVMKRKYSDLDKDDIKIRYQASRIAFNVFWVFFIAISTSIFFRLQNVGSISFYYLAMLAFSGWLILYLSWSVSTLVLYSKVNKNLS